MRTAVLLIALAVLASAAFTYRARREMVDFDVYRVAGARAIAGEPLYRDADEHYRFKYFPASAFVFAPFALLPSLHAKALWFGLSVACLVLLLVVSIRHLPRRIVPPPLLAAAAVVTLAKFYARELNLGQANLLFGVLAVEGIALLQRRSDTAGGVFFGASVLIKPYGLVFLPYLLATRRLRAAGACAVVIGAALIAPALQYGIDGNLALLSAWWSTTLGSTPSNLLNPDNVSYAAMYARWMDPGPVASMFAAATGLLVIAICGAAIALRRMRDLPEYLEVALLLTAIVFLSPQGWDYVLLLSTPAVVLLVNALPRLPRLLQLAGVICFAMTGLTVYDVMGRSAYAAFMQASGLTLAYGVLMAMLLFVRAKNLG